MKIKIITIEKGKMKTCSECKNKMTEKVAKTPEGISYKYFKCNKCEKEIVDMKQLHDVAERYKVMKKILIFYL